MNFQNAALTPFLVDGLRELDLWPAGDALSLLNSLFSDLSDAVVKQGGPRRDILVGRLGDDTLRGGGGNDWLLGLAGNDSLFGEEGNDRIWGGSGDDLIDGGAGINILRGGPGRDRFVLRPDDGIHRIKDYEIGIDQFRLQGGLTFSQLSIVQAGEDTQIRYLRESEVSVVLEDTQASELSADDFVSDNFTPTFDSLFIYGDSLSDPGNLFNLTGFFPPPPYSEGRFTNGDIWADYFTDSLLIESDRVFNFAVGGSTTGEVNVLEPRIESLAGVDLTLPGLTNQIDSYIEGLGGEPSNDNGLYVVWAGANDLFNTPENSADIPSFLANSVGNIIESISRLAAEGADTFLVPNLPNLGLTPRGLRSGNSAQIEALSATFNANLEDALDTLESTLDIDIVDFDVFSSTDDIINSPESFGFTNVTDPLIQQLPPIDSGFFWWDEVHPTTAIHRALSDSFQAELFEAGYLLSADDMSLTSNAGVTSRSSSLAANRLLDSLSASLVGSTDILQQDVASVAIADQQSFLG